MVTMTQIRRLAREIQRDFAPQRIVLFGSYARGSATIDSDVDLLVVLPFTGKALEKAVEIRLRIRPPFPVDIVAKTPEMLKERIALGDPFLQDALQEGKVLYEAPNH